MLLCARTAATSLPARWRSLSSAVASLAHAAFLSAGYIHRPVTPSARAHRRYRRSDGSAGTSEGCGQANSRFHPCAAAAAVVNPRVPSLFAVSCPDASPARIRACSCCHLASLRSPMRPQRHSRRLCCCVRPGLHSAAAMLHAPAACTLAAPAPSHKTIFVLLDGVGDVTVRSLADAHGDAPHGRTPLQRARTPTMDLIARHGLCGLLDSVEAGQSCGSDTAHLSLLGYDPQLFYRGRGAFEAQGSGLPMQEGDVAFKSNFACMDSDGSAAAAASAATRKTGPRGIVRKRRADRAFHTWGLPLIAALDGMTLPSFPDVSVAVQHATEHRCGVRLRGPGLTDLISGTDPLVDARPLRMCTPTDASPEAVRTSAIVNELSARMHEILSAHPINVARAAAGLPVANIVLLRGAGARIAVRPFPEAQGLSGRACMVAPTAIIAGLGTSVGFDILRAQGATGDYHTDLFSKARTIVATMRRPPSPSEPAYDFGFLHIKAVDDAGHDRDVARKIEYLERSDAMLSLLLDLLRAPGAGGIEDTSWSIVLTGDHSTPVQYGDHSVEPVPFVVSSANFLPRDTQHEERADRDVTAISAHSSQATSSSTSPSPAAADALAAAFASPLSLALRQLCSPAFNPTGAFDEEHCSRGLLGRFPGREIMPLLRKFEQQVLGRDMSATTTANQASKVHHVVEAAPTTPTHLQQHEQHQLHTHLTERAGSSSTSSAAPLLLPLSPSLREGVSPWVEDVASSLSSYSPPPGTPLPSRVLDVVVIGGGFTGLATAWELGRSQKISGASRVAVLEREHIGSGATGRNGGHMTPVSAQEERDILSFFAALHEEGVRDEQMEYKQKGGMSLLRAGSSVHAAASNARPHKHVPSTSYVAGAPWPAAGCLQPMKMLLAMAGLLRDKYRTPVFQNTPVTRIERDVSNAEGVWILHTPRGTLRTRAAVHATNAWASDLLPTLLGGLVVPVRNHVVQTTPIRNVRLPTLAPEDHLLTAGKAPEPSAAAASDPANESPLWEGLSFGWHDGFDYMCQRPSGRVVVGGHRYLAPGMDVGRGDSAEPLYPHIVRALQGLLPRTFTQVFDEQRVWQAQQQAQGSSSASATPPPISISHVWGGIMGFTASGNPLIGGLPELKGQFVAAGFSGHGMPRCHPAGIVIAKQVADFLESGKFEPIAIDERQRNAVPRVPGEALLEGLGVTREELLRAQQGDMLASKL